MRKKLPGILISLLIVAFIVFLVFYIGIDTVTNQEALTEYVRQAGIFAPLVFFLIQFLQVIIAPIPGNITGLVGGAVFGLWFGFLLNAVAVFLGSQFMFYLGKRYGKGIAQKFMSTETFDKYEKKISGKAGKGVLMGIFLVPFFPDDIICLIAGVSNIDYKTFALLVLVGRTPSSFVTSAMGAGIYSGKIGIVVIGSLIYYLIAFLVYWKYDQIIQYIKNKTSK
jgi:uncharacterized membrane protein YdjX (TVP38/TMEM64 family)